MSTPTCRCGRPTSGGGLCQKCSERTMPIALANIAAYTADLDTMRARRRAVRYDLPRGKGGSKEIPLPLDGRFVEGRREVELELTNGNVVRVTVGEESRGTKVADETRNTITTWARIVLDEWPPITTPWCDDSLCRRCNPLRAEAWARSAPIDTVQSCCVYLTRMLRHIAGADWAGELLEELLHTETQLRKLVDNPPERWYAGPCTAGQEDLAYAALCGTDLYANVDRDVVQCRECGAVYAIADRRAWLLTAAEDRLETATVIAHAAVRLGGVEVDERRLFERIRQWASRKRIHARDTVIEGGKIRPRYRVGDVLDLLLDTADDTRAKASEAPTC